MPDPAVVMSGVDVAQEVGGRRRRPCLIDLDHDVAELGLDENTNGLRLRVKRHESADEGGEQQGGVGPSDHVPATVTVLNRRQLEYEVQDDVLAGVADEVFAHFARKPPSMASHPSKLARAPAQVNGTLTHSWVNVSTGFTQGTLQTPVTLTK